VSAPTAPSSLRVPTVLGDVAITVAGSGPALLLWPSLLMTGSLWAAQADRFAATHTVIAVDPPGHGASDPLRSAFTFEQCAQVIEQILDHLEIDAAHVVGNSWGGMIGITFAATRPQRTRSCVLMNCTASPAGHRQRLEYGLLVRAARLRGGLKPPLTGSAVNAFLGPTSERTRPDVVAHVRAAALAVNIASARWAVTSVVPRRPDQRALLPTISAPVLVVAGREDRTFPVPEVQIVADGIPEARFVVIEDAAHLAALEVPDRVNELLDEHLAGVG